MFAMSVNAPHGLEFLHGPAINKRSICEKSGEPRGVNA
jgi:hypothetical protein